MFESLQERLGSILNGLTGRGALSEADVSAALREVRRALLEADVALEVVRASLEMFGGHRIATGPLLDLIRRVQVFGFFLAELEIRQHSDRHTEAIAEMLGLVGVPGRGVHPADQTLELDLAHHHAGEIK